MLDFCYGIIDLLLPFPWLGYNFMKNAFLAILLVMPLFGLLGTMVVNNKMAFFSDSLGHGAFAGIAVGTLLGTANPLIGLVLFSVVFAIAIIFIKDKSKAATDTVIGVFSSTAIALGIMMMSRGGSFNKYTGYLIGDLLSIKVSDLGVLIGVFIVIVTLWYFLFNKLLLISVNTSLASSRGLAPLRIEICFAVALAIIVAVSIQWVGLLIINSMLVLPAAAARNLAVNIRQYHCYAVGIALLSGILVLMLSYYLNTATGATIVIIAALIFFLSLFKK